MKQLLWLLKWMLIAAIFFSLFAFALNNQQEVTVHFFFGQQWRASLVLVVLACFAAGLAVGALGMVPRWWMQRRAALQAKTQVLPAHLAASPARHGKAETTSANTQGPPHGI
ncbi:MAG: lipopolysaccharide assembly LapA domain-containing protein [Burkholderiaceae bacterium]